MKRKTFKTILFGVSFLLAGSFSYGFVAGNYVLPAAALAVAVLVIAASRRQVSEVMNDERDLQAMGNASRWAIAFYTIPGAAVSAVLMALRRQDPVFEIIGSTIAYSVCVLLLLQVAFFKFFEKRQ